MLPLADRLHTMSYQVGTSTTDPTPLVGANPQRTSIIFSNLSTAKPLAVASTGLGGPEFAIPISVFAFAELTYHKHGPVVGAAWYAIPYGFVRDVRTVEVVYQG